MGKRARLIDRWPRRGGKQSRSDQPRDVRRTVQRSTARIADAGLLKLLLSLSPSLLLWGSAVVAWVVAVAETAAAPS
jgi:hypothetical protein